MKSFIARLRVRRRLKGTSKILIFISNDAQLDFFLCVEILMVSGKRVVSVSCFFVQLLLLPSSFYACLRRERRNLKQPFQRSRKKIHFFGGASSVVVEFFSSSSSTFARTDRNLLATSAASLSSHFSSPDAAALGVARRSRILRHRLIDLIESFRIFRMSSRPSDSIPSRRQSFCVRRSSRNKYSRSFLQPLNFSTLSKISSTSDSIFRSFASAGEIFFEASGLGSGFAGGGGGGGGGGSGASTTLTGTL